MGENPDFLAAQGHAAWVGRCASCTYYTETSGFGVGAGRCALHRTYMAETDTCDRHSRGEKAEIQRLLAQIASEQRALQRAGWEIAALRTALGLNHMHIAEDADGER